MDAQDFGDVLPVSKGENLVRGFAVQAFAFDAVDMGEDKIYSIL